MFKGELWLICVTYECLLSYAVKVRKKIENIMVRVNCLDKVASEKVNH